MSFFLSPLRALRRAASVSHPGLWDGPLHPSDAVLHHLRGQNIGGCQHKYELRALNIKRCASNFTKCNDFRENRFGKWMPNISRIIRLTKNNVRDWVQTSFSQKSLNLAATTKLAGVSLKGWWSLQFRSRRTEKIWVCLTSSAIPSQVALEQGHLDLECVESSRLLS